MTNAKINSVAFHEAQLQSERLRIFGVLSFLGLLVIVLAVRILVVHTATLDPRVWWIVFVILIITAWQYRMLANAEHALKAQSTLSSSYWIVSTLLEASLPAWAFTTMSRATRLKVFAGRTDDVRVGSQDKRASQRNNCNSRISSGDAICAHRSIRMLPARTAARARPTCARGVT